MSDINNKRHIKTGMLSCGILLLLMHHFLLPVLAQSTDSAVFLARPKFVYQAEGRRDPFVQPASGRSHHAIEQVDIESLKLTGIIRNPVQATALFTTQTGPGFGFLLKSGKLYRENHQFVSGITGEVLNPHEVLLKQDGKSIVFKLR